MIKVILIELTHPWIKATSSPKQTSVVHQYYIKHKITFILPKSGKLDGDLDIVISIDRLFWIQKVEIDRNSVSKMILEAQVVFQLFLRCFDFIFTNYMS